MKDNPRNSASLWTSRVVGVAYLVLASAFGFTTVRNYDIGLHVRTGEYVLEQGLPSTNVFSEIHSERPMVDDKWLFQAVVALVHRVGGFEALSAFRCLLVVVLAVILVRACSHREARAGPVSVFAAAIGLVVAHQRFLVRPELVSLVFLASFLLLATRLREGRSPWRRRLLFALQVVWVNVHGYFILGPLVLALFVVGTAIDERRGQVAGGTTRRLNGTLAFLVGACFLTPYGIDGTLYPVETLLDLEGARDFYRSTINEFRPTLAPNPNLSTDAIAWRALSILVLPALLFGHRRKVPATALLLVAAFFVMSLELSRNMSLFGVVGAASVGRAVEPRVAGERVADGARPCRGPLARGRCLVRHWRPLVPERRLLRGDRSRCESLPATDGRGRPSPVPRTAGARLEPVLLRFLSRLPLLAGASSPDRREHLGLRCLFPEASRGRS